MEVVIDGLMMMRMSSMRGKKAFTYSSSSSTEAVVVYLCQPAFDAKS